MYYKAVSVRQQMRQSSFKDSESHCRAAVKTNMSFCNSAILFIQPLYRLVSWSHTDSFSREFPVLEENGINIWHSHITTVLHGAFTTMTNNNWLELSVVGVPVLPVVLRSQDGPTRHTCMPFPW